MTLTSKGDAAMGFIAYECGIDQLSVVPLAFHLLEELVNVRRDGGQIVIRRDGCEDQPVEWPSRHGR